MTDLDLDLTELTAVRIVEGYRKGEFSPEEATRAVLERAERIQPEVNAFVRLLADEALAKRWIAGAALDVFEHEPLAPDSPLWEAPGLIVSPHMSGDTIGWRDELGKQFVELYERWEAGRPLLNVVDKKRGYVPGR